MGSTRPAPRGRGPCRSGPRLALLLALLAPLPGAAAAGKPCSVAEGPWQELRSRHFTIDAAGWRGDPARLVRAFEQLHAAVLAALIAEPVEIPGRVRVFVLPRKLDLVDFTGSLAVVGLFWVSPLGEPTILLSGDQIDEFPQVVAHELTHHVASYVFPRQPYWFAEGLAQFVEGVAKVDGQGRRWAGGDPAGAEAAGSIGLVDAGSLVAGEVSGYLTSWILYRFLWNEHGKELSDYQRRLMDGEAPGDAWDAAFPQWSVATGKSRWLHKYVAHHQLAGRGVRWEVALPDVDSSFAKGPVSLGDVHAALLPLRLAQLNPLVRERTRTQELEEAEGEDPGNPLVSAEVARLRGGPLLPALRAACALRPGDGRGWYLLGTETDDPREREEALRRAVERWPEGALARAALAAHLASSGHVREALPLANRAVDLAPWSPIAVGTLAGVAAALGQCPQALALQARAVESAESRRIGSSGSDAAQLRKGLAEMRKRCAAKAAPLGAAGGAEPR
jgi:tetratricopeptide (TPR) repeat protein